MKISLLLPSGAVEHSLDDGTYLVGGGYNDSLRVRGVAPRLAELRIQGERAFVTPRVELLIDGVATLAGVERLLLPAERLVLAQGYELRRLPSTEARAPEGTAAV